MHHVRVWLMVAYFDWCIRGIDDWERTLGENGLILPPQDVREREILRARRAMLLAD